MSMKTFVFSVWVLAMFIGTGCEETAAPAGGISPQPAPANPLQSAESPGDASKSASGEGKKAIYLVRVQLATVEVPLGVASDSEELWSHLDEEPVSLRSRVLGMNGFRVGLGRQEDWSEIETTLKKMTGQSFATTTAVVQPGVPAPVELQRGKPTQLLFTTREDQTLSGEHIPPGDYLLTMTCTLNEDDPSKVLLSVVPQVRSTKRQTRLVYEHGSPAIVQQPVLQTLTSLAFQLTVKNNDFVVIGPGIQARRPTSPGQAFLMKERKAVPFETVILLRPMVHTVEFNAPAEEEKK